MTTPIYQNPCYPTGIPTRQESWFPSRHDSCRLATADLNQTSGFYVMLHAERFQTVSSLYGPGAFLGWFLVDCSVFVSWMLNSGYAGTDKITNDFFAAGSVPAFAAADALYQIFRGKAAVDDRLSDTGDKERGGKSSLITSWYADDMRAAAALEAPLTVCEDFIAIGLLRMALAVAGNKMHLKRMGALLVVGTLCVAVQMVLFVRFGGIPAEHITMSRLFLFECPLALTVLVGLYTVIWGLVLVDAVITARRRSQRTRHTAMRLLRRVVLGAAVAITICQLYLKYYCRGIYGNVRHIESLPVFASNGKDDNGTGWWDLADGLHNRFVPKSAARFRDLDQVVPCLGGLITLFFSIK
ncbi:hypothetical protein C8A03DRAFT_35788 [Achaetomium macrosporum]|uniref:Uncharacterized protein n=1 Tax=Achaetomium macrosporum TaxID=79813 RepID=A0AAN7H9D7_9PEZI|nr:hypothetical protein C8A03DRAFT_35788 [Achaetomium macrosporum]